MTRDVYDYEAGQRYGNVTMGLLLALIIVVCADVAVRVGEARLSGDVASKRGFDEVMQETVVGPGKPLIAAVGSSLVGRGVDTDVLEASLATSQDRPVVAKLAPDNSTIWDWTCVVEQHLLKREPAAKTVIIGFAWDQLSDRAPLILRRNFNNLCAPSKLGDFSEFSSDVHIETWLDMAAVTTSKLYTHREPIRDRVFSRIIPNYQTVSQDINERNNARTTAPVANINTSTANSRYRAAQSLLQRLGQQGTHVVLVAMPVQEPYEIERAICSILGTEHEFLDMRGSVPSDPALYRDPIHLNEEGARRFSAALAAQLRAPGAAQSPCTN